MKHRYRVIGTDEDLNEAIEEAEGIPFIISEQHHAGRAYLELDLWDAGKELKKEKVNEIREYAEKKLEGENYEPSKSFGAGLITMSADYTVVKDVAEFISEILNDDDNLVDA